VCTGALVLAAAGLLEGRQATTHWAYHRLLERLGATYLPQRWVEDGKLITSAGVSAGIDMALALVARLTDEPHRPWEAWQGRQVWRALARNDLSMVVLKEGRRRGPNSEPLVRGFGDARTCAADDCSAQLSRYNPARYCCLHQGGTSNRRSALAAREPELLAAATGQPPVVSG